METLELMEIIARGEDSRHQFKRNITNETSAAQEMCAFANSQGGMLIIGVDGLGNLSGLSPADIRRLNALISSAATNVRDSLAPRTENIKIDSALIMVVHIPEGTNKPYFANDGTIWIKSGADKRKVVSREELRRLFQESDLVHADEVPVQQSTLADFDAVYFDDFYFHENGHSYKDESIELAQLLQNLHLARHEKLNLAGVLLFGKNPQQIKPQFNMKAVHFVGLEDTGDQYLDSEDIGGKLSQQYLDGMAFIKRNLRKEQSGQSRNTLGISRIPESVFEELLVNALVHRNYFIDAPIRLFIFEDRIEIISPGTLPNNLTVENIKAGVSNQRNPIISSFATKQKPPLGLPYRGIGTGIKFALKHYPKIELINDTVNNLFYVKIYF